MRKLAIIGAGPMAGIIANRARELGIETHCFAWSKGASARDDMDFFHDVSVTEVDEIARMCEEIGIGGVVATTELTVYPAAYVARRLGLTGLDPEVAAQITNKYRNRERCRDVEGLSQPPYWLVRGPGDLEGAELTFPVIVKPTSEGGKRGVTVVPTREELASALEYAEDEKKDSSDILVEGLLGEGIEYSVESLSFNGRHSIIQVTRKWSTGAPHCVEVGHHQPAPLPEDMRLDVEHAVERGLTAVGLTNGPCHTEVKICDGKIYLIEFNARPGGGHITFPLTELSTGYPYLTGIIETAFGNDVLPERASLKRRYAGFCIVCEQTRWLKPVFDTCQDQKWCYDKHYVSEELVTLQHNQGYTTNYIIYYDPDSRPSFLEGRV